MCVTVCVCNSVCVAAAAAAVVVVMCVCVCVCVAVGGLAVAVTADVARRVLFAPTLGQDWCHTYRALEPSGLDVAAPQTVLCSSHIAPPSPSR